MVKYRSTKIINLYKMTIHIILYKSFVQMHIKQFFKVFSSQIDCLNNDFNFLIVFFYWVGVKGLRVGSCVPRRNTQLILRSSKEHVPFECLQRESNSGSPRETLRRYHCAKKTLRNKSWNLYKCFRYIYIHKCIFSM